MVTTEQLLFELQRRVILFKSSTVMPDGSFLGYNGNPNDVSSSGTAGEKLIYNCPQGTRYQEEDGTQWVKSLRPNEWVRFATGDTSLKGHKYLTPKSYSDVNTDVADEAGLIAAIAAATDFDTINLTADITLTATLIINKPLKITGEKRVIQSAGAAGDPTLLISITSDDVYITDGVTIKHRKTTNTSVEAAISVNALRYIGRCRVEYMEFGYLLRGSWSISGEMEYTGALGNSHRMCAIYSMASYSEFTNIEYEFPQEATVRHNTFLVAVGGADRMEGILRLANIYPKDSTKIGRQFFNFESLLTDNKIGFIVEDCTLRMANGDMFAYAFGDSPLDKFDFIALTGIESLNGQATADNYKGLFYIADVSGTDRPLGNTTFYYANNTHQTDLRTTYTSITDTGGITYETAWYTPSVPEVITYNWSPFFLASTKLMNSLADVPHDKGWFIDEAALVAAYPTGVAGDWAIVGATDTVWIWDTDPSAWVDSGTGSIASWGSISGTLSNQTDLQEALDAKVDGAVFISDIVPTGTGNVGEKTYSSDGEVLESCTTDTQLVTVSVLALTGHTNYKPVATINSTPVTLVAESDAPLFRGTINIDLALATELTVVHEDGASHTVAIVQEVAPEVLTANFTGGYPGTQTELKENDTYDFALTTDVDVVAIEFDDYGAFKAQSFVVAAGTSHTVNDVVIADRGTTVQALGAKVRVQKATGSWSDWYLTENDGVVDGTNLVNLNNLYPSVSFGSVTYPLGQGAIKGTTEEATVANTVSDYDTIAYSSPTSELTIANDTTYEASKVVTRLSGDYNVSVDNIRIQATRAANNAVTTENSVVFIANVAPTINITIDGAPARLRSGGNDGTAAQNYTVRITSDQNLYAAPTLTAPEGTWQGGGFAGSGSVWTRTLQIHDNDLKGAYNFASLSAFGLAGLEQTSINSGAGYELGGFVSRIVPLDAFAYETSINTEVITYNKVTFSWSFGPSVTVREPLNSARTITNGWCLVAIGYGVTPVTVRVLDDLTDTSSQESYITIEEVV